MKTSLDRPEVYRYLNDDGIDKGYFEVFQGVSWFVQSQLEGLKFAAIERPHRIRLQARREGELDFEAAEGCLIDLESGAERDRRVAAEAQYSDDDRLRLLLKVQRNVFPVEGRWVERYEQYTAQLPSHQGVDIDVDPDALARVNELADEANDLFVRFMGGEISSNDLLSGLQTIERRAVTAIIQPEEKPMTPDEERQVLQDAAFGVASEIVRLRCMDTRYDAGLRETVRLGIEEREQRLKDLLSGKFPV